jgi:hypothetical protein
MAQIANRASTELQRPHGSETQAILRYGLVPSSVTVLNRSITLASGFDRDCLRD